MGAVAGESPEGAGSRDAGMIAGIIAFVVGLMILSWARGFK